MHRLTLYYSVSNGGDGSAYPQFSLSKELCDIHQEIQSEFYEGWGEPCVGEITLESDSPITVSDQDFKYLLNKESLIEELDCPLEGGYYEKDEVKEKAIEFLSKVNSLEIDEIKS
jgi:hypothetical protein